MAAERWQRAKDVFQAVLTRTPETRRAFLDEACGDDSDLRQEVESLLGSHDEAGDFLSRPALLDTDAGQEASDPAAGIQRIGPYRILDAIAHGGMGTVYRAVRDDDAFRKTVALKRVRGGRGSDTLARRFRQERQILARLQHPNIATVLDGGTTDDGQPYLVMEYVEGRPITEYCAAEGLGTRERLALFQTVCGAVQYAHQNLVVHRDIKPANVLVNEQGIPKLLDFGIAKMLASGVDPDVAPTATMLPMMTPEYASPEQVKGQTLTTASDVYSLGVLLYELLAGQRPYEVKTDSLEGIVLAVCEMQPRAPSDAIADRAAGPPRPARGLPPSELRGDLDTIVLKALRKEPERRYSSAHELSEDVRRYLEGRPVTARADTLTYRTGKFVRRHRTAVAAAVVVSASLVGGIVTTTRQARIAEANRQRAERRFGDVRKLANSFLFDIHDEIRELPGSTRTRQRLVATAQEYLDSLAREAQGDAGLQRELAAAYERLGDVQGGAMSANLGNMGAALESYRKAMAIREALASTPGAGSEDGADLARLQLGTGTLLRGMGRLLEADALFRGVTERLEALAARGGAPESVRSGLFAAYAKRAGVEGDLGRGDEARRSLQKAIEHGEPFCRDHPEDAPAQTNLASCYYLDSLDSGRRGEHQHALERVRQARAIQETLHQKDALNQSYVRGLLFSLNGEAVHLSNLGQQQEAVQVYRQALGVAEDMLRRDPQDRWAQAAVTVAWSALGLGLIGAKAPAAALAALSKGREIGARLVAEDPANGFVRNELAAIDSNIGLALLATRTRAAAQEACQAFARSLDTWRQMKALGPLTADSVAAMRQVEAEMTRCGNASIHAPSR